jgi:hypothetical protein
VSFHLICRSKFVLACLIEIPAAVGKMAPRKTPKDNEQGPARGGQRKRARRDSSQIESEARNQSKRNVQDSVQDQATVTVLEPASQQPVTSWSATVDSFERDPMSVQVQKYKNWRRTYLEAAGLVSHSC